MGLRWCKAICKCLQSAFAELICSVSSFETSTSQRAGDLALKCINLPCMSRGRSRHRTTAIRMPSSPPCSSMQHSGLGPLTGAAAPSQAGGGTLAWAIYLLAGITWAQVRAQSLSYWQTIRHAGSMPERQVVTWNAHALLMSNFLWSLHLQELVDPYQGLC